MQLDGKAAGRSAVLRSPAVVTRATATVARSAAATSCGHERGPERAIAVDDQLAWAIAAAQPAPAVERPAAVRDGHERHVCTGLSGGVAGSAAVEAERLGAHRTVTVDADGDGVRGRAAVASRPGISAAAAAVRPASASPGPTARGVAHARSASAGQKYGERCRNETTERHDYPAHERAPTTTSTSWGPNA